MNRPLSALIGAEVSQALAEDVEPTPFQTIESAAELMESGDTANGIAFAQANKGHLCCVRETGEWKGFTNSGIWEWADPEIAMHEFSSQGVIDAFERVKKAKGSTDHLQGVVKRARLLFESRTRQEAALKQARPHLSVSSVQFNRASHLLGVTNGVLNLDTLELVEAPAQEYISMRMGCAYDPDAKAPMFERFILQILPDAEIRGFFQQSVGAALSGTILDNGFVFMLGESGDNGKSVACNVLTRLFGSYAMTASADLLLQTKHDTEHRRLIAGLSMGPRAVFINEIPKHAVWDDARVKNIGSRDNLQARKLFGEIYSFTPTHHVFIRGNHAPGAQDSGEAFWKRVWPVAFDVQIPKSRQIAGLDDKISAKELPGVLNWALAGAAAWRAAGRATGSMGRLVLPQSMIDARERYRGKTDYIGQWLAECTDEGRKNGTARTELWSNYRDFCQAAGLRYSGIDREFYDALEKRGYVRSARDGVRVFRGLQLKGDRRNERF